RRRRAPALGTGQEDRRDGRRPAGRRRPDAQGGAPADRAGAGSDGTGATRGGRVRANQPAGAAKAGARRRSGRREADRAGDSVRPGARRGRGRRARRRGHAPLGPPRQRHAGPGATPARSPPTMRLARLALAFVGVGLVLLALPSAAHAWTPGTHIYLGESVLGSLSELPTAVADLLRAYPFDFLYGNIAADSSIAKHYAPLGRHCHYWHVGQEIHDLAATDALRRVRLGYLCHP